MLFSHQSNQLMKLFAEVSTILLKVFGPETNVAKCRFSYTSYRFLKNYSTMIDFGWNFHWNSTGRKKKQNWANFSYNGTLHFVNLAYLIILWLKIIACKHIKTKMQLPVKFNVNCNSFNVVSIAKRKFN